MNSSSSKFLVIDCLFILTLKNLEFGTKKLQRASQGVRCFGITPREASGRSFHRVQAFCVHRQFMSVKLQLRWLIFVFLGF